MGKLGAFLFSGLLLCTVGITATGASASAASQPTDLYPLQWSNQSGSNIDTPPATERTQEELRERSEQQPKQKYRVNASDFLDDVAPAALNQPDPATVDECRQHFDANPDAPVTQYKNHLSLCQQYTVKVPFLDCSTDPCTERGSQTFRVILVGNGSNGTGGIGEREMVFQFATDKPTTEGSVPPPNEPVNFSMACPPTDGPACEWDNHHAFSWSATLGEIRELGSLTSPTFRFMDRTTQGDGPDLQNLFALAPKLSHRHTPGGLLGEEFLARCDQASYASGGGCIYTGIEPVIQYSKSDPAWPEFAQHIADAQSGDMSLTKPGIIGKDIPGALDAGKPLTRMFSGHEKQWYDRNNAIARANCVQYWGPDYATNAGYPRDCDEYPFRSTHEGAAFNEMSGIDSKWSYSSRPIRREQNRAAGRALNAFYLNDHVIHGDAFWVDIIE